MSSAGTPDDASAYALRGASLAFAKPPVKPKPLTNTYTGGSNGALLAATKVTSPAGSAAPLRRDRTGGSVRSVRSVNTRPIASPTQVHSKPNSSSTLGVPIDNASRSPSPSNIAAKLAVARSSPLRPIQQGTAAPVISERNAPDRDMLPPTGNVGKVLARLEPTQSGGPQRKRRDSMESRSAATTPRLQPASIPPTDDTPIPPTTTLVQMFEQNRPVISTNSRANPSLVKSSPPPIRSPKPQRTFALPPEPTEQPSVIPRKTRTPPPIKYSSKPSIELAPTSQVDGTKDSAYFNTPQKEPMKSPVIKQKPAKLASLKTDDITPPRPPPQRGSRPSSTLRRLSTSVGSIDAPSSPASFKSAKEVQEDDEKPKPNLPPPRRSTSKKPSTATSNTQPGPSKPLPMPPPRRQPTSSAPHSPSRLSPPRRPASATGTSPASVYHNAYQRSSVQQIAKHMTGESLSSAIMGAALASSRNVSPAPPRARIEPPLFPPRKQHHHHSPFHRSPSPPKKSSPPKATGKLRTTMRKDPSSSSDEDSDEKYKRKGTRIMGVRGRKHPNKHHEGERKRWRDQITERERKRYEGVWAANKGLYLVSPVASPAASPSRAPPATDNDPAHDVLNLVVREIWCRSRLPTHVLEEVWALVDGRAVGRLRREEFVVGMWLVDQRLKGRKLPVKVTESVWSSARGVSVKVKVRK